MSTKTSMPGMLNQQMTASTPFKAPIAPSGVHPAKAPGDGEFAFLGPNMFRHPLINRGKDIAVSPWAHMAKGKI